MTQPVVTVVMPAHNASATLGEALDALAVQSYPGASEIIVVDDASNDSTATISAAHDVRVITLAHQSGPATARNAGVAAAQAPLIAFTDADCVPELGWLAGIVAGLDQHDLVQGPVVPARPPGPWDRTLSLPSASPRFETANLGVRRDLFDRVGGFERLAGGPDHGHFGEDAVFGWRAVRVGARVGFCPTAVVRHAVFPRGPRGYLAERRRLRFFPALVREVPEMRQRLPARIFLSHRTALFDLALMAVAAATITRRKSLFAATAPYLWARVHQPHRLWRRSVARANLVYVVGDAIGFAALVRGSLRARRIVL